MRALKPLVLAALAATATVLTVPRVALANGGHLHFGTTHIPLVVVIGFGGFAGVVMVFFFANWARYRRAQSRGGPPQGPERSQTWEEEEDDDTR